MDMIIDCIEKVGIGIALFLCSYVANVCLGAWRSVKLEGYEFDWKLILESVIKFVVLGIGITLLSAVVSVFPMYLSYVGIDISEDAMQVFDSLVIVGAFVSASVRYVTDAYEKLKEILGV